MGFPTKHYDSVLALWVILRFSFSYTPMNAPQLADCKVYRFSQPCVFWSVALDLSNRCTVANGDYPIGSFDSAFGAKHYMYCMSVLLFGSKRRPKKPTTIGLRLCGAVRIHRLERGTRRRPDNMGKGPLFWRGKSLGRTRESWRARTALFPAVYRPRSCP